MTNYILIDCYVCAGAIPKSYAPEHVCPKCGSTWKIPVDLEAVADNIMARELTALALKHEGK